MASDLNGKAIVSVVIGDEYDDELRQNLMTSLQKFGGKILGNPERFLAGSQDMEQLLVQIGNEKISVESETYVGITITGPEQLIATIRTDIGV